MSFRPKHHAWLAIGASVSLVAASVIAQQPTQPPVQQVAPVQQIPPAQQPARQIQPPAAAQPGQQALPPGQQLAQPPGQQALPPGQQVAPGQQQATQPGQQQITANRPVGATTDMTRSADQQIADLLAICNQKEIALAQIAKDKLQDKKAREFADMMVKDHTQQLQTLKRFGAMAQLAQAGQSRTDNQARPAQASDPRLAQTAAAQKPLDFVEVELRIADVCVANARKEWNDKKKDECDMAYIGQQLVAHQGMVDAQRVLRDYAASPELRGVLDQGMQTAQVHLDHAKDLIHELAAKEREANTRTTQR